MSRFLPFLKVSWVPWSVHSWLIFSPVLGDELDGSDELGREVVIGGAELAGVLAGDDDAGRELVAVGLGDDVVWLCDGGSAVVPAGSGVVARLNMPVPNASATAVTAAVPVRATAPTRRRVRARRLKASIFSPSKPGCEESSCKASRRSSVSNGLW